MDIGAYFLLNIGDYWWKTLTKVQSFCFPGWIVGILISLFWFPFEPWASRFYEIFRVVVVETSWSKRLWTKFCCKKSHSGGILGDPYILTWHCHLNSWAFWTSQLNFLFVHNWKSNPLLFEMQKLLVCFVCKLLQKFAKPVCQINIGLRLFRSLDHICNIRFWF